MGINTKPSVELHKSKDKSIHSLLWTAGYCNSYIYSYRAICREQRIILLLHKLGANADNS